MKNRAPKNRTITLSEEDKIRYSKEILKGNLLSDMMPLNKIIQGDIFKCAEYIPKQSVDLLFLDPPYNLRKTYQDQEFRKKSEEEYSEWFGSWFRLLLPALKETATVYICCDWQTSVAIYDIIKEKLIVRNRITWEREKGRGAVTNYKNSHEDIWFATKSNLYTFNVDAVKLKRRVIAPYKENGTPKDWEESKDGNFRLTHPGNLWTDISIPFWSMPENTDHPTQKPEKLAAKLLLASTNEGDVVLDPFAGSGTTAVTAKKLNRKFYAVELAEEFVMLGMKRLELAEKDPEIQGYHDGVFWERNTLALQKSSKHNTQKDEDDQLF